MVPQFLQATIISADIVAGITAPAPSPAIGAGLTRLSFVDTSLDSATGGMGRRGTGTTRASRLLNAGQPPHPCAPPAPLHCPSPGQEPGSCSGFRKGAFELDFFGASGSVAAADVGARGASGLEGLIELRLKLVGRGAFRVF